jgi:hypothetical protein
MKAKTDKGKEAEKLLNTTLSDCCEYIKRTLMKIDKGKGPEVFQKWQEIFSALDDISGKLYFGMISLQGLYNQAVEPPLKWQIFNILNTLQEFFKAIFKEQPENYKALNLLMSKVKDMTLVEIITRDWEGT